MGGKGAAVLVAGVAFDGTGRLAYADTVDVWNGRGRRRKIRSIILVDDAICDGSGKSVEFDFT